MRRGMQGKRSRQSGRGGAGLAARQGACLHCHTPATAARCDMLHSIPRQLPLTCCFPAAWPHEHQGEMVRSTGRVVVAEPDFALSGTVRQGRLPPRQQRLQHHAGTLLLVWLTSSTSPPKIAAQTPKSWLGVGGKQGKGVNNNQLACPLVAPTTTTCRGGWAAGTGAFQVARHASVRHAGMRRGAG